MTGDHTIFNIRSAAGKYLCPVCGFAGQFDGQQFDHRGGVIGTGICASCFYEPGFDDDPAASASALDTVAGSILAFRDRWIADGMPWRATNLPRPDVWDAASQLRDLFTLAPFLAETGTDG